MQSDDATHVTDVPALGVTPILVTDDAAAAVSFYRDAFAATELARIAAPDGMRLLHVRLEILGSRVIIMDELAEVNGLGSHFHSPSKLKGTSVTLHVQVERASLVWDRAIAAGGKEIIPLALQFWGEIYGRLADPFGHEWTIAEFVTPLSNEQIHEASESVFGKS